MGDGSDHDASPRAETGVVTRKLTPDHRGQFVSEEGQVSDVRMYRDTAMYWRKEEPERYQAALADLTRHLLPTVKEEDATGLLDSLLRGFDMTPEAAVQVLISATTGA